MIRAFWLVAFTGWRGVCRVQSVELAVLRRFWPPVWKLSMPFCPTGKSWEILSWWLSRKSHDHWSFGEVHHSEPALCPSFEQQFAIRRRRWSWKASETAWVVLLFLFYRPTIITLCEQKVKADYILYWWKRFKKIFAIIKTWNKNYTKFYLDY